MNSTIQLWANWKDLLNIVDLTLFTLFILQIWVNKLTDFTSTLLVPGKEPRLWFFSFGMAEGSILGWQHRKVFAMLVFRIGALPNTTNDRLASLPPLSTRP